MEQQHHSPGPWMVGPHPKSGACYVGVSRDGRYAGDIAELHFQHSRPRETQEANARLIAAAPELLVACRELLTNFWGDASEAHRESLRRSYPNHPVHRWEAAINKAEGR